jgi:hypothetical protein
LHLLAAKKYKEYTFQEFQKLPPIEQTKVYKDFGASCGNETTIAKLQLICDLSQLKKHYLK